MIHLLYESDHWEGALAAAVGGEGRRTSTSVWALPAAMATAFVSFAGKSHWPFESSPQAATLPFAIQATE